MKHSLDELIQVAYRYYPRGVSSDDPRYNETEEYGRLVAARRHAGANYAPWRGLLQRLREEFPEREVQDRAFHLPSGGFDAGYSAWLHLPTNVVGERNHLLGFLVSVLVPGYIVYSSRFVDDLQRTAAALEAPPSRAVNIYVGDTMFVLPASVVTREVLAEAEKQELQRREELRRSPYQRQEVRFQLAPDEQVYADWITRDIETTFGYERMPPDVGMVIVPDIATGLRSLGQATLYDCLFSDQW